MSEATELEERARQLRALATDVEGLLTSAKGYVSNDMASWEGPNQEEVSGALTSWETECVTVAGTLNGLADSLDAQAADAREEEEGEDGGN
jgi:uncharacterized protein YukE